MAQETGMNADEVDKQKHVLHPPQTYIAWEYKKYCMYILSVLCETRCCLVPIQHDVDRLFLGGLQIKYTQSGL